MKDLRVEIYTSGDKLPTMRCANLFHSAELFRLYERTPRHKPYMLVATDGNDGHVLGHLLAVVRYRVSFFPPYIYTHCHALGEGEYEERVMERAELFGRMLKALTVRLRHRVLYIEISNISQKMFAYRQFRHLGYFPVRWLNIHNSLHSRRPEERLSERTLRRIENGKRRGVTTTVVSGEDDLKAFCRLLHSHNRLKPRRYIPDESFFRGMMQSDSGRLFLTKYKERAVGCCACVYTGGDAYLWYIASLRKRYINLHPGTLTLWAAIRYAYDHGCAHIRFLDVGMPFRHTPFRDFILTFGGKQVSGYRWFRVTERWLNALLSYFYRD